MHRQIEETEGKKKIKSRRYGEPLSAIKEGRPGRRPTENRKLKLFDERRKHQSRQGLSARIRRKKAHELKINGHTGSSQKKRGEQVRPVEESGQSRQWAMEKIGGHLWEKGGSCQYQIGTLVLGQKIAG